jgi:nucleotide-binding universal stress UspA family protein
MFHRVLVPVDLSGRSSRALEAAASLAGPDGEVTLLHVIETLDLPFEELEDFYQRLHDKAAQELDELIQPLSRSGVTVVQRIAYGHRLREILAHADGNAIDLIVMSSRRLDREDPSAGFASLSHQVAILAQTPVLLMK